MSTCIFRVKTVNDRSCQADQNDNGAQIFKILKGADLSRDKADHFVGKSIGPR